MALTKREIEILNILTTSDNIDMEFLAGEFSVSLRTIRYSIENLNYYLNKYDFPVIDKNSKGILYQKEKFSLSNFLKKIESRDYKYLDTERVEYIYIYILFNTSQRVNIVNLASLFQVSELTVKSDIKKLKDFLKDKNLSFRYNNIKGFYIDSPEITVRKEMIKTFMDKLFSFESNPNKMNLFIDYRIKDILNNYIKQIDQNFLKNYLKEIEGKLVESTSNEVFELLIIYFSIAILRIKQNNIITQSDFYNTYIIRTKEYKILTENIDILGEKYNVHFNEEEILKLAEYFLGSHTYNYSYTFYENWIEVEILVRKLIGEVNKNCSVDISKDKLLFEGLLNHIKPTIYRIKNDIYLPNIGFEEILENCSDLFLNVKRSLVDVEKYIGHNIKEDEVALFTVHFKLAIDRVKEKINEFSNVLFVCGSGYASSSLLAQELLDTFDINVVDLIPYYRLKDYDLKNIDFIISTVKIPESIKVEKEIIQVNVILSEKDKILLENKGFRRKKRTIGVTEILEVIAKDFESEELNKIGDILTQKFNGQIYDNRKEKTKERRNKNLLDYLNKENIVIKEKETNWRNVVDIIGNLLLKDGCIEESYIKSMKDLVDECGTFMVLNQRLMILHAENNNDVIKTGVSFLKLNSPVVFPDNKKLRYIFGLSCLSKEEISETLNDLVILAENDEFFSELERKDNPAEILKTIKKYVERKI
jgi:mannitol operon transcriptional antiterminator